MKRFLSNLFIRLAYKLDPRHETIIGAILAEKDIQYKRACEKAKYLAEVMREDFTENKPLRSISTSGRSLDNTEKDRILCDAQALYQKDFPGSDFDKLTLDERAKYIDKVIPSKPKSLVRKVITDNDGRILKEIF